ncbi:uncharacterized protein LOC6617547 [Drosophila sechellia]|uniref:GM11318 n=1 Tax=Drosophila sechellia TaxID=7238 RepID=B4IDQ1_DROSE|nr:uncharacterized protein LOC6617547 [Drosophila sechellia]EDW45709.1 GM11318 [Drosophila sechellia]
MSTEMSKFFGGGRRVNRNMALQTKTGTGVAAQGGEATKRGAASKPPSQRNPKPTRDAVVPGAAGASRLGGGTGASQTPVNSNPRPSNGASGPSAAGAVPKRPANRATTATAVTAEAGKTVPRRATGGGVPARGVMQTTATSTLRRRAAPPPPARIPISRRLDEVNWIMKPSDNFVPCSESSSEGFEEQASGLQERKEDHAGELDGSSSSGHLHRSQLLMSLPAERIGRTRIKGRTSRIFRVPSQRIMHVDQLMQAQLRQMDNRKTRAQSSSRSHSRSPNWSASRLPSPLSQQSSFRSPSISTSSNEIAEVKDVLLRDARTVIQIPATGLESCSPSPDASPAPSQSRPIMSSASTCCTMENGVRSSTSTSSPNSNTTSSKTSVIECINGIRTPSTEQLNPGIQGALGSTAIKLTSTVMRLVEPVSSKVDVKSPEIPMEKDMEMEKKKLTVQKGNAKTRLAMNAPMVQSISPPKFRPMVKVPIPISQSVNHVVDQLTAQLKEAAMMHKSKDNLPEDRDTYEAFGPKDPFRKASIYLIMDQPRNPSGASTNEPSKDSWVIQPIEQPNMHKDEATNRYLDESIEHPRQYINQKAASQSRNESKIPAGNHMIGSPRKSAGVHHSLNQYVMPPKARRLPMRNPSKSSLLPRSRESKARISKNPYIEESKTLSRLPARRPPPVSVNRPSQPSTSTGIPKVLPPPEPQKPETPIVGKIIRKEQHMVPRTMEDGIDMSYQYFVSIPLKRGRKPQVVRYLYRPMVRQLNAPTSPNRRSRRASRKAAAAAAAAAASDDEQLTAAEGGSPKTDPELKALGGVPVPLEDPPQVKEPVVKQKIMLDPEAVLNGPYEVPPLKLDARYKSMMEQLAQMPYPEDRTPRSRRRRSNRQARAAGGADQGPTSVQDMGVGDGDALQSDMNSLQQVSSIWKSGSRLPKPVNYQPEPKRLCTATGAPMSYHSPVQFTHSVAESDHFILPAEPMIQTITYDDIEQTEQKLLDEKPDQKEEERKEGTTKSVSFHPGEAEVSEFHLSSSTISISLTSSSNCGVTKTKASRTAKKRKSKSKGRGKLRK